MRLWTLHPQYLDAQGLVALWREALLAQAVLSGQTRGYHNHPQLLRFKQQPDPVASLASYLQAVHAESVVRGYRFDASKISTSAKLGAIPSIAASSGQIAYEWQHLLTKLQQRSHQIFRHVQNTDPVVLHPMFHAEPGPVATWEKVSSSAFTSQTRAG